VLSGYLFSDHREANFIPTLTNVNRDFKKEKVPFGHNRTIPNDTTDTFTKHDITTENLGPPLCCAHRGVPNMHLWGTKTESHYTGTRIMSVTTYCTRFKDLIFTIRNSIVRVIVQAAHSSVHKKRSILQVVVNAAGTSRPVLSHVLDHIIFLLLAPQ